MFKNIKFSQVSWVTSSFLIVTLLLSVTAVPWYLLNYDVDWALGAMFFVFYMMTGLSITLGYHRLFSHQTFKAKWPVRLFVLIFGAAAFENSAYWWSSEHRKHHKHCDHEDDPYDITQGFMWAHMGWLMFKLKPPPPIDNVKDLEKDPLVMWQHKHVNLLAPLAGMVLPAAIAGLYYGSWSGALGGLLIPGILRIVAVQHSTFCINSLCHCIGKRPYSKEHSARDSWISALFTFGEGYHNFHHSFANDYRNGIRAWHWDPTKWSIWLLSIVGLTDNLRVVSEERILLTQMRETQREITEKLNRTAELSLSASPSKPERRSSERATQSLLDARKQLDEISSRLATYISELQEMASERIEASNAKIKEWRKALSAAAKQLETLQQMEFAFAS